MHRLCLLSILFLAATFAAFAQTKSGACTEDAIKNDKITVADDVFMYMTPYGKPVVGKSAAKEEHKEKFAGRTNIKRDWVGEHRIVSSPSADMAYEAGTMEMSYDENGKPNKFQAVMLVVYKDKGGACQLVAQTMEPLESEQSKKDVKKKDGTK